MRVNFNTIFSNPTIKLFGTVVFAFCTIFFLAAFMNGRSDREEISKRVNIAVRAIGHHVLLGAGDSTSIVRPVVQKSNGVFFLEFENEFVFEPETLVSIVEGVLNKTGLSKYSVTVYKCYKPSIIYGFEINPPDKTLIACVGRNHPKACYNIEIAFADFPEPTVLNSKTAVMISGILSLLAVVLISRNLKFKKSVPSAQQDVAIQSESNPTLTIGKLLFDTAHQRLKMDEENISLTDKECKILTLLNRNIGRLTLRDELIQEVWTDEGVITGRSLDMFISKLRKKLSADPELRITNVHGKGYRLEIVTNAAES